MRLAASLACGAVALAALPAHAAGKRAPKLKRAEEPVVLEGSQLARLNGTAPDRLVAYRYKRARHGKGSWKRVPVQVDERAQIDFGLPNGGPPSGDATVYGTAPDGTTALQYTDPGTFVGADPNPSLDGDDEVAFMAKDTGARAPHELPAGVKRAGATEVAVRDPLTKAKGWLYLFEAGPKLDGEAKRDYVNYDFVLQSGDYMSTYLRGDGPNPETSTVATSNYSAGFSDRWLWDALRVLAPDAGGAEILDGLKFGFAPGACSRSEATFSDAEGAFVVNRDGPVRAIRSYVGANSGPYTQRTHYFYLARHEIVTDLRVHPIGSLFNHYDLSPAGVGMTYRNDANRGGVPVDGVQDSISSAVAAWHLWTGSQGTLFAADRRESSFDERFANGTMTGFYEDDASTPIQQCWGDSSLFGSAGVFAVPQGGLPNTDPRVQPVDHLAATNVNIMASPGATAADADRWRAEIQTPLTAKPKRFGR